MTEPESTGPERTSGWEKADRVAHGAGQVIEGTAWLVTKGWALALIIIGVVLFCLNPAALWWIALLVIAYGVYLILPGSKWVIW